MGLGSNSSNASELAAWATAAVDWQQVFAAWVAANNSWPLQKCHVTLRRRKHSEGRFAEDISLPLRRELALCLEKLHGWVPEVHRSAADLELQVILCNDGNIVLEVPILVQRRALGLAGGLPRPGMKQVEAWAIAKSLEPLRGEVVLDPMCGKGTLLAEAANWWPDAHYVGCDSDWSQLEASQENFAYLSVHVETHLANATYPRGLPLADASVDKIMTAPPWDRQFAVEGDLGVFYRRILEEFRRVLRPNGRMVLLASRDTSGLLIDAVLHDEADTAGARWCVVARRCFDITDETIGVLLVVELRLPEEQSARVAKVGPLWWEDASKSLRGTRAAWSRLRAKSLPTLQPFFSRDLAACCQTSK
eukprot:TRINITY_DN21031_c0_g1_i1.p1 TRINITY_DN21031_c0_g1~~TRINITY_DN21031_c0_g1_i1.p1  ORF type:complete len:363 (-),score=64.31 TRINITY_DN21031_c0_g1_i1:94-1182(-)